jgi:hypothetical protein
MCFGNTAPSRPPMPGPRPAPGFKSSSSVCATPRVFYKAGVCRYWTSEAMCSGPNQAPPCIPVFLSIKRCLTRPNHRGATGACAPRLGAVRPSLLVLVLRPRPDGARAPGCCRHGGKAPQLLVRPSPPVCLCEFELCVCGMWRALGSGGGRTQNQRPTKFDAGRGKRNRGSRSRPFECTKPNDICLCSLRTNYGHRRTMCGTWLCSQDLELTNRSGGTSAERYRCVLRSLARLVKAEHSI